MSSSFRRLEFTPTVTISLSRTMSPSLLVRLWTWIRQCVTTSVFSDGKSPKRRFGRKQPCSYIPRAMDDGNISFSNRKLKQRGDNKALLNLSRKHNQNISNRYFSDKEYHLHNRSLFQQCLSTVSMSTGVRINQVNRNEENQNVHKEFFIVKLSMSTLKSIRSLTF